MTENNSRYSTMYMVKHQPVYVKITLFTIFFLFISWVTRKFFASVWLTNDDAGMLSFADGSFTGNFEENLVYQHHFIGEVLASLYSNMHGIPWYPAFQIFLICLGFAFVTTLCISKNSKIMALVLGIYCVAFATSVPSFTISSALITACSIWVGLKLQLLRRMNHSIIVFTALLLASTGILIRPDMLLLVLGIFSPVIAYLVTKSNRRSSVLLFASISMLFLLQIVASNTMLSCKTQQECASWKTFLQFQPSDSFHGSSRMEELEGVISEIPWSQNDFNLFERFAFTNEEPFTNDYLNIATDLVPKNGPIEQLTENPFSLIKGALAVLQSSTMLLIFAATIGLILLGFHSWRILDKSKVWSRSTFVLITPIGYVSLILILNVIRSPVPERVIDSSAYIYALVFLWFFDECSINNEEQHANRFNQIAYINLPAISLSFILLITTDLILPTGRFGDYQRWASYTNSASNLSFKEVMKIDDDRPILATGATSWILNSNPWNENKKIVSDAKLFFLGWPVYSPHYTNREILVQQQVNYFAVANGEVLLFAQEEERNMVLHFIGQHFGVSGRLEVVRKIYGDLVVYEFVRT
jgi:hypothetical protein